VNITVRRGQVVFGVNIEHGDFYKVADYLYENHDHLNIAWHIKDSFIKRLVSGDEDAKNRFSRVVQIRMQSGKGYFTKLSTMNRNKADVFKILDLEVNGSNLCVAPETEILTNKGYLKIGNLENSDVTVWNGRNWSDVTVKKTGVNKQMLTVKTSRLNELRCTPYHKFYIQKGGTIDRVDAKDLKVGDKLIKFDLPVVYGDLALPFAYSNGFFTGDGFNHKGQKKASLFGVKKDLIESFGNVHKVYSYKDRDTVTFTGGTMKEKFFVPRGEYDLNSKLDWLAGIIDSDGCLTKEKTHGSECIQITTVNADFSNQLYLFLQELGVFCTKSVQRMRGKYLAPKNDGTGDSKLYNCKEAYRLIINGKSLEHLKNLGIKTKRVIFSGRSPKREAQWFETVTEVFESGYSDTFCFTEPQEGKGMFNGILTGNCNELNLPSNREYTFSCPIINANLTMYRSFPKHLFHLQMIMQDANVSGYLKQIDELTGRSREFMSKIYNFTKDFRAVGCGTAGLHSLFMQERIPVGSFDSIALNDEIFSRMRKETYEASEWLGKVLGVPPKMEEAGLTRRNATTMFSPPTKSSAELSRNTPSEGIGLQTALVKVKEVTGTDIFRIEPAFLVLLKEKGKYNNDVIKSIVEHGGSCQHLDFLTEHEKKVFLTAFEIPMEAHLMLCSGRQPYFDQQQSINLYLSGTDTPEYITKIHLMALLDENINGLYYCYSMRGGVFERLDANQCEVCQ
jgi:ribonucleoside-diphosphate reductase alpha chain